MSGYLDIYTADSISVSCTADNSPIVSITPTDINKCLYYCEEKLGAVDSLAVVPFQASSYVHYEIPEHLLTDFVDVGTLNTCVYKCVQPLAVAIVNTCAYIDNCIVSPEGVLHNRILSNLSADYIGIDHDTGGIPAAFVLNTDFSNSRLSSVTDVNGNKLSIEAAFQETRGRLTTVEQNVSGYESNFTALVDCHSATVCCFNSLFACVNGINASITSDNGVFSGVQKIYNGVGTPQLCHVCYGADNRMYRYAGEGLGWVATDVCVSRDLVNSIEEQNKRNNRKIVYCDSAPVDILFNKYDILASTTQRYGTSHIPKIKVYNGTAFGSTSGIDSVVGAFASIDCAKEVFGWMAVSEKLIKAPNGAVTGWQMYDGSGLDSCFKISANNFSITSGESVSCSCAAWKDSFSIQAGTPNKIKFSGVVDFTNTDVGAFTTTTEFGSEYNVNFENTSVNTLLTSPYLEFSGYSNLVTSCNTVNGITNAFTSITGGSIVLKDVRISNANNPIFRVLVSASDVLCISGTGSYVLEKYNPTTDAYEDSNTGAFIIDKSKFVANKWVNLDTTMVYPWSGVTGTRVKCVTLSLAKTKISTVCIKSATFGGGVTNSGNYATADLSNVTRISGSKINTEEIEFGGYLKNTNGSWKIGASGMFLDKYGISIVNNGIERVRIGKLT